MRNSEKVLLDRLKNYTLIQQDVAHLVERLSSAEYAVTPTLRLDGGSFGGGGKNSKVENLAIRRLGIEKELEKKQRWLRDIDRAIVEAGLNKRELELIRHTIRGGSLSAYARQKNIYKSHVYKIRDGAVRKMWKHIEAQNVR